MSGSAAPKFATLGHQENWGQVEAIVGGMRPPGSARLTLADMRSIIPWIPPRTVSRFSVAAVTDGPRLNGIYIDTFISPDELGRTPGRQVLARVQDAIIAAEREGVSVMSLGGFTSILLESGAIACRSTVPMTTGNALTAALILRGVERACALLGRDLAEEEVLVIGATGDVGSACARALNGGVRKLLLSARNRNRLEREGTALAAAGPVQCSTDVEEMLGKAGIVIAAASTPAALFSLERCRDDAIVCDAGYPKNIAAGDLAGTRRLFWGGMGVFAGGVRSDDGMLEQFYRFPVPGAAHGCMLEGAVLAMAGRYEAYSQGRGLITPARLNEIWTIAQEQGVGIAPLFNADGLWPEEVATAQ